MTAPPAYAHFNASNSVDSGEIRYENYTQWNDSLYWARDRWNYVGRINIAADTASTIADLEVRDYRASDDRCGYATTGRLGADLVALNSSFYDGYNTDRRRACTLHEFGHTLGLGHSYESQAMDPNPVSANPNYYVSPQGHDQADYHALWG
ncbi:MAG: hypothetical protein LH624_01955 [Cryobacterium sp.]|nr:hypothetical protein [Cryobacterium sp.]